MDTALKQRLVGAAVLVALAVIFLPMLIKGPAPESGVGDVPLKLPAAPRDGFETRELPLVTPQAPGAGGALQAEIDAGRLPTVDAGVPAAASDAQAEGPQAMTPPATAGGDYAVSFGSYATAADATRVVGALTASQLPGYQEPVPGRDGRTVYRVRIGPFATQADAESARLRAAHVRDDVGSKVVVLDAAAAASTASSTASATQPLATAAPAPSAPVALPATPSATTRPSSPSPKPSSSATPVGTAATPATPAAGAASTAATQPAPAGAAGVGYAVQLGAFGNAEEANRLRDRARAAGFSAFVEQVHTDKGTLSRVRIGPVADRAEADSLRARVAARLGIAGIVRPHP